MSSDSDPPKNTAEELPKESAESPLASKAAQIASYSMDDLYGSGLEAPATSNDHTDSDQKSPENTHVMTTETRSISPPTTQRLTEKYYSSSLENFLDLTNDDRDHQQHKRSSVVSSSDGSLSTTERFDDEASRSSNSVPERPYDHHRVDKSHEIHSTVTHSTKANADAVTGSPVTQQEGTIQKDHEEDADDLVQQKDNTDQEEDLVDYPDFLDSSSDNDDDSLIGDYALPGRTNDSSGAPPPQEDPYPARKPLSSSTTTVFSMGSAYDQLFCRFGLNPGSTATRDEEYAKQDLSPGRTSKSGASSVREDVESGRGEDKDTRSLPEQSTSPYQSVLSTRICGGFLRLDILLLIVVIVVAAIMIIAITAAVLRNSD